MAHQHYKGTGQIHSFRGTISNEQTGSNSGGQDKIRIEGATGDRAWRITKFQTTLTNFGQITVESVVKIYRERQTSFDGVVNFTDDELLASNCFSYNTSANLAGDRSIIIFDNALFVRNIYVTSKNSSADENINYYIELEEVKVSAAGMAQLAVAAARRT